MTEVLYVNIWLRPEGVTLAGPWQRTRAASLSGAVLAGAPDWVLHCRVKMTLKPGCRWTAEGVVCDGQV